MRISNYDEGNHKKNVSRKLTFAQLWLFCNYYSWTDVYTAELITVGELKIYGYMHKFSSKPQTW